MSSDALFAALGFSWDRAAVPVPVPQAPEVVVWQFRRSRAAHVWDLSSLEGNPFTYPQVQTLLDGVTVGGHKLSDEQQVLRIARASDAVVSLAAVGPVSVTKAMSDRFNGVVAETEALEAGHLRGEGTATVNVSVHLGEHGTHQPQPTHPGAVDLIDAFTSGVDALERWASGPVELAVAYFAFAADQQFYFDGNKRTARCVMDVVLLSHGHPAVLVPAARQGAYNQSVVRFLSTRDATDLMRLLAACGPLTPDPAASGPGLATELPPPRMDTGLGL